MYGCHLSASNRQTQLSAFSAIAELLFLFVYGTSCEPLNGFAPNSHGRRVWSIAQTSLKVKVKDQRSRSPGTKTAFFGPFGGLHAVYVW